MTTPEYRGQEKSPENKDVNRIPESIEISESLRNAGVKPTVSEIPTNPDKKAEEPLDKGGSEEAVRVPVDQETAGSWSKGSDKDARTWYGRVILRLIKKALRWSKQVVVGDKK